MDLFLRLCFLPPELVNLVTRFAVYRPVQNDSIQGLVNHWCAGIYTTEEEQQFGPISDWDTSEVTAMSHLFWCETTFNDDICRWDVSQVTTMNSMFSGASTFNQPLASWNVSLVTDMRWMFDEALSFNQSLETWNTNNLTERQYMFNGCPSYFLNSWRRNRRRQIFLFHKTKLLQWETFVYAPKRWRLWFQKKN